MSTLRVNTIQNAAGSGSPAIDGAAKAWVSFNGTGTVAIRASGNVSSITDNGTGDYAVNFTTAMTDTNYAVTCLNFYIAGNVVCNIAKNTSRTNTTSLVNVVCMQYGTLFDFDTVDIAVFR